MKKLAIVTTHPIQYYAPIFELLSTRGNIDCKVFYTWGESVLDSKFDPEFQRKVEWDIPLLNGYKFFFLKNIAKNRGSHHFRGIINPDIIPVIRNYDPDAILVIGWSFQSHLKVLRYFKGKIPIIFRGDSTLLNDAPDFSLRKFVRYRFLTWVYRHVDIALYVGHANKAYYKKFGLTEDQLIFAPHAVDNTRFFLNRQMHLAQAHEWRKKLKIQDDAICFLFAGKLIEVKNIPILLEAFRQLDNANSYLIVVGNGGLETSLKKKYTDLSSIRWIDFQNQSVMPIVYSMADVYILPSKSETWGLSVNEAMASGLAVITSNKVGCSYDLVSQGENGFVFESGNISQLTNYLNTIATSKANLESMKQSSLQIISEWSFEKIVIQLEAIVLHKTVARL